MRKEKGAQALPYPGGFQETTDMQHKERPRKKRTDLEFPTSMN